MHTLYLIRGVPGCGKSTLANELFNSFVVDFTVEADEYFVDEDDNYIFDASKLGEAHTWCQKATREHLQYSSVAVSNTSTTEKEVQIYQKIAEECGAKFVSIVVENRHEGKNEHNVPEEVLQKMKSRFTLKL